MLYSTKFLDVRALPATRVTGGEGLTALTLLAGISTAMGIVRGVMTNYWWFLEFIVWNLFLAIFPLGVMLVLRHLQGSGVVDNGWRGQGVTWLLLGLWLLFMPNAPYIITDLFHLRIIDPDLLWFDTLMIFIAALTGLLVGVYSTAMAHRTLSRLTNVPVAWLLILACHFLAGFGIYLGRYIRLNSWNVLDRPMLLIESLLAAVRSPLAHKVAVTYGFTLAIIYVAFHIYSTRKRLIN